MPGRSEIRKAAAAAYLLHLNLVSTVRTIIEPLNIPWILLKGAALSEQLYPEEPSARAVGDCDVLIRHQDRALLESALRAAGFRSSSTHNELFTGSAGQVDVHTSFVNRERITARGAVDDFDVWPEVETLSTPAGVIPVLGEKDFARYLALHLVHHHGMIGAKWIVDLQRLLKKFPNAQRQIAELGPNGDLLLRVVAGKGMPRSMLEKVVLRAAEEGADLPGLRFLLTLRDISSPQDRMKFLVQAIFPNRELLRSSTFKERGRPFLIHLKNLSRSGMTFIRLASRI